MGELRGMGQGQHSITIDVRQSEASTQPCPESLAWFFPSRLFFLWVSPLFTLAKRVRKEENREIEEHDLWELGEDYKTNKLCSTFEQAWSSASETESRRSPKEAQRWLKIGIWAVVGRRMKIAALFKFLNSTVQFGYPLITFQLLTHIRNLYLEHAQGVPNPEPLWKAYGLAMAFGAAMLSKAFFENLSFWNSIRAGFSARSVISTMIYRKSLRLTQSSRQRHSIGEIVNLMQLDATKFELFISHSANHLWDSAYQVVGNTLILYLYIGWASFLGLAVMIIAIPVQSSFYRKQMRLTRAMVKITDNRVKTTNEVLQGIQGIKMSGWELKYSSIVESHREKELDHLRRIMRLQAVNTSIMMSLPALTAVVSLSAYALSQEGAVSAATLFAAISAFGNLRFPLMTFGPSLLALAQVRMAVERIGEFLALDEVENSAEGGSVSSSPTSFRELSGGNHKVKNADSGPVDTDMADVAVCVSNGEFYWSAPGTSSVESNAKLGPDAQDVGSKPVLRDINMRVRSGSLTAIVGQVGAGKSSLLSSILNETYCSRGSVQVQGSRISYSGQSAWLMNCTIRDNITFGLPFDEMRYSTVVKACQLEHDLGILEAGDLTMIGERGINLSGGQKQRVSLARAAYADADVVVLDDPLSALDPEVAHRVFESCILGLLHSKTRILVTNQLQLLERCDSICVIEATAGGPGGIVEQGTFRDMMDAGLAFSKLMEKYNSKHRLTLEDGPSSTIAETHSSEKDPSTSSKADSPTPFPPVVKGTKSSTLMQKEERSQGAVRLEYYLRYARAGGGYLAASMTLLLVFVAQFAAVLNSAWVAFWSSDLDYEKHGFSFYMWGYFFVFVVLAILGGMRTITIYYFGLRVSRKLHHRLLRSVLHSPMSYFDTTPIGRIISRFSKDLYLIDNQLNQSFSFFFLTVTSVFFGLVSISYSTPIFLACIPFIGILYIYYLQLYRPLARDTKRLESISRSPIYAHFSETLGGLSTIRAFRASDAFRSKNAGIVDTNIRNFFAVKCIERWLAMRLEILGCFIAVAAACFAVSSSQSGDIDAGLAGLSLTFAMLITNMLNQTVRSFAELEQNMNSIERVVHYTDHIEQEAPFESATPPPLEWPENGRVVFNNLAMQYRKDTPLVLRGIDVVIPAGASVGVVGRTGSGKSSLLLALLRIVEPARGSGPRPIEIDGVDVCSIGLHDLRQRVSIVPQHPAIFSGTVRSNVDPFQQFSDERIWKALDQCRLQRAILDMGGLDSSVSEGGENFSAGQKQLLCLARCVLQESRILLLDEATSSVDYETDAHIQDTIRLGFPKSTVIVVAHRLRSVAPLDYILVMQDGLAVEFDTPASLVSNPASVFSRMVESTGPSQARALRVLCLRQ